MPAFFPDLSPRFSSHLDTLTGKPLAILGHLRPDGDCLGSQVGLARILQAQGFDAVCVNEHPAPRTLAGFLGDTPLIEAKDFNEGTRTSIACDAADHGRLGAPLRALYPEVFLCIDHHLSNPGYATHNLIDAKAAATAEIIAGMCFDLDFPIDPVSAQALYVGIATDTGQFQYGGTTRRVFELAGRLLECGASPADASIALYEQEPFAKIKLLQRFLQSMHLECEGRVCIGYVRRTDYADTDASIEDTEGFVDYARSLDGVDIGIILDERGTTLKGSLRAKDPALRVDKLAGSIGGGGHACAAGFSVYESSIEGFSQELLSLLQTHLREHAPL